MTACPFYAHYFYSEMIEHPTRDIPTAATDGRRIFYNPAYLASLKPSERVFVFAHEVDHVICKDPQRMKTHKAAGSIDGAPFDQQQYNIAADYVINAGLVEQGVGMINPDWMWAQDVDGNQIREEVYKRKYKKPPESQGSSGKAGKGAKGDGAARAQGNQDQVLEPETDPVTGREDLPSEMEFKEAIARAAAAAKAMGNMPDSLLRKINEILQPQVDWRDHLRMTITGRIGSNREDHSRLNRRRAVLNPLICLPGRRGNGAGTIVVGVDTSGSISQDELNRYLAEVGGIIADVRPKRVVVIGCDARVSQVEEAATLDDVGEIAAKGLGGGGGTSFIPVFKYVDEHDLRPDALIYCTDGYGAWPAEAPRYPTIWAITTDVTAPFGDVVRIKPGA
jgi:predicted metal-dependent peptidase